MLDIGCNAGFYSIEMKKRGAGRVLGIDSDQRYLDQARLATEALGFGDIEFARLDVYDVAALGEKFDLVIFMGVLYHLRHPLLALDLIREHVAGDRMLFQTMQQGTDAVLQVPEDHPFHKPGTTQPPDYFDNPAYPKMHFIEREFAHDWTNWWAPNAACSQAMLRAAGFTIEAQPEPEVYLCRVAPVPYADLGPAAVYPARGERRVIEGAMIWNEPNNKSHWNPELDPDWSIYADTVIRTGKAIAEINPGLTRVLGGMSPDRPALGGADARPWRAGPGRRGGGARLSAGLEPVADPQPGPTSIAEIEAVAPDKPIWATEVGVGSFGAEEVQVFGLNKTAELLIGRVPNVYWYSLFDLPQSWGAETRHREAEGSSYYRHFYMGLIREDGTPKPALDHYARVADQMGLMQWFHFHDPRLDDAVRWMKDLGVKKLRTGISWADSFREGALDWFDRQMEALSDFEVLVTFCFTPEHLGVEAHHTSCARDPGQFADFCAEMVERYAPAGVIPDHSDRLIPASDGG